MHTCLLRATLLMLPITVFWQNRTVVNESTSASAENL
jgi:hypothetical protein